MTNSPAGGECRQRWKNIKVNKNEARQKAAPLASQSEVPCSATHTFSMAINVVLS